jgi:four helix bundle protein
MTEDRWRWKASASGWCRSRTWKCSSALTRVSLEIHRASLTFPAVEQRALADQIRRASKSICANLAEGYGRQKGSKAEFARFVRMAIGSSDEMRVWLRHAFDLGYIDEPTWRCWREEYQVVTRMLQSLADNLRSARV